MADPPENSASPVGVMQSSEGPDFAEYGSGVPAGALTISNNSGWTYTPFPPPPRVKDLSPWNYDYSNFSPFFFFDFNIGYSHWHRTVTYDDGTTSTEPGCGGAIQNESGEQAFPPDPTDNDSEYEQSRHHHGGEQAEPQAPTPFNNGPANWMNKSKGPPAPPPPEKVP